MMFSKPRWNSVLAITMMILVVGSIWGLAEATLGGFLHAVHLPQKGAVMGGLAISFMGFFTAVTRKPLLVPLLGLIAAAFKPLDAVILSVSPLSPFVVNPAVAIILEAVAFGLVVSLLKRAIDRNILAAAGAGLLAGYSGYVLYMALASVVGWGRWPMLSLGDKLHLVLTEATPIALAGAFALAAGYHAGKASAPGLFALGRMRPQMLYSTAFALVLVCWTVPSFYHVGG